MCQFFLLAKQSLFVILSFVKQVGACCQKKSLIVYWQSKNLFVIFSFANTGRCPHCSSWPHSPTLSKSFDIVFYKSQLTERNSLFSGKYQFSVYRVYQKSRPCRIMTRSEWVRLNSSDTERWYVALSLPIIETNLALLIAFLICHSYTIKYETKKINVARLLGHPIYGELKFKLL